VTGVKVRGVKGLTVLVSGVAVCGETGVKVCGVTVLVSGVAVAGVRVLGVSGLTVLVSGVAVCGVTVLVSGVSVCWVMGEMVPPVMGEMVGRDPVVIGVKVAWASAPPPPQENGSIVIMHEGSIVGNPP
jgi:hypothetical protein